MALKAQIVRRMLMIVPPILVYTVELVATRLQASSVNVHQEELACIATSMMPVPQTLAMQKPFVRQASSMDPTPVAVHRVTLEQTATRISMSVLKDPLVNMVALV